MEEYRCGKLGRDLIIIMYKKKEKESSSSSGYIPTIENNEAQLSSSEYVHEVIGAFFSLVACLCVKNGRRRSVNIT
jgi:hypothetical protein